MIASDDIAGIGYRSKLFDRNHLNLACLDRKVTETKQSKHPEKLNTTRDLHRFEFIELIVRLALVKYRDTKICLTLNDSVETLISHDLLPHN